MFEHATLQEAYTGALIAGKGKALNNINLIMERTKVKTEDWARVRFGAGTPWRRCWCVITPPDEKEVIKLQKQVNKKKSAYDRSKAPALKGDIKFYDSRKTKKVNPIATITNVYTAYAIYPQAKPLIDASTLVKVEGSITIHSNPPSTTEGFVFVMPEVHPAITGFEMMLRWLFPVFDTFALYGRPGRLVADTTNPESLMFAMPKHRRYGYLEILDVSGLILEQGSANWRESEWRKRMKDLTQKRMAAIESGSRVSNRFSSTPSRRSTRNSFGPSRSRIQFDDAASTRSSPSMGWQAVPPPDALFSGIPRTDSAPPASEAFTKPSGASHNRSVSETQGIDRYASMTSNYDGTYDQAPSPPLHSAPAVPAHGSNLRYIDGLATPDRVSSEDEERAGPVHELQNLRATSSPEPVAAPPAFSHTPGALPATKPYHSPELRRANNRMSTSTLHEITGASGVAAAVAGAAVGYHAHEGHGSNEDRGHDGPYSEDRGQNGVLSDANHYRSPANRNGLNEGVETSNSRFSFDKPAPQRPIVDTHIDYNQHSAQFSYDSESHQSAHPSPSRTYEPPNVFSSNQNYTGQGHSSQNSRDSTNSLGQIQGSPSSVNRKPLPARPSNTQTLTSADTMSSDGTLKEHIFDNAAFDMIQSPLDRKPTAMSKVQRDRAESTAESVYTDVTYEDEPDYASTIASHQRPPIDMRKLREDKPRAGVMRTVGVPEDIKPAASIPNIDFGPTLNLASGRASPGPGQLYSAGPRYGSPARGNSPGFDMPLQARPQSAGHSRSPSRNALASDSAHYRNDSGESRTLAWQPAMSNMGFNTAANSPGITPEQFVQQRAAAATPLYAHQRNASSQNNIVYNASTPGLVKNLSSDRLAQLSHSRNSSTDLLQRPSSRGPSAALAPLGNGDMPAKLSAREQEHVARMTGQPLVNMAGNKKPANAGLVGAIETREKERQQMQHGINNQAVQRAIQRQQQAMQQTRPDQANYGGPQSPYAPMGQHPQQFAGHPPGGHQSWVSPQANVYAQGGGFSAPSPSLYGASPEQGMAPSPSVPGMPPQQFFPTQQRPQQGQGRGSYQGRQY